MASREEIEKIRLDWLEIIARNFTGATKQCYMTDLYKLFYHIDELQKTNDLLRKKINQLRKEIGNESV